MAAVPFGRYQCVACEGAGHALAHSAAYRLANRRKHLLACAIHNQAIQKAAGKLRDKIRVEGHISKSKTRAQRGEKSAQVSWFTVDAARKEE